MFYDKSGADLNLRCRLVMIPFSRSNTFCVFLGLAFTPQHSVPEQRAAKVIEKRMRRHRAEIDTDVLKERHHTPLAILRFEEYARPVAIEDLHSNSIHSVNVLIGMMNVLLTSSSTSCSLRGKQCINFQSGFAPPSRHSASVTW